MKTSLMKRPILALMAALAGAAACDDDTLMAPGDPLASADVLALDFGTLDTAFGSGVAQTTTITNTGSSALMVGPVAIAGDAAADFAIAGEAPATSLAAGASMEVTVTFDPTAAGARTAAIIVPTDDPPTGSVVVALAGTGSAAAYAQVDRVGIPTLNTVFNHPPQFSKTDYNTASPTADLEAYTGLFETVLGAVANDDPPATAALLLPDALPVNMGAAPSAFASLTGRALADDAVDVALTVVVGPSSLHSDNVGANDVAFPDAFPYLAAPHN